MVRQILIVILLATLLVQACVRANTNPIAAENRLSGTSNWRLENPATHREIEGYASATSVNRGEDILLFASTKSPTYTLSVFRMGWYQGLGARRVFGPRPVAGTLQVTPSPDRTTGLVEADWIDPYTLSIPIDWVSGVYLAKLTNTTDNKQSYIIFVVRDDQRNSDLVFQLPITTYQAYNFWGGKSLYSWGSGNELPWGSTAGEPAVMVSFNRPFAVSTNSSAAYGAGAGEFLTNLQPVAQGYRISSAGWDYNMLRWLEREGFDVSYITSLDTHSYPDLLKSPKAFLSVGHDEYWSWEMRQNVEAARDYGTNLAFFSANSVYWQVRFEDSFVREQPDRTMIAYKKKSANDPYSNDADPSNDHLVTTRWRDSPVSLSEHQLIGVRYLIDLVDSDIVVSNASHWVFQNTGLENGSRLIGLLGYEVDGVVENQPPGIQILATSPAMRGTDTKEMVLSNMTIYRSPSNALVFATGSMQWSWGLDDFNVQTLRTSRLNCSSQQITRNVLVAFGAMPSNRKSPPCLHATH